MSEKKDSVQERLDRVDAEIERQRKTGELTKGLGIDEDAAVREDCDYKDGILTPKSKS